MWLARMESSLLNFVEHSRGTADPAEISGRRSAPQVAAIQGHQAGDIMLRMGYCIACAQGKYPPPSQTFRCSQSHVHMLT